LDNGDLWITRHPCRDIVALGTFTTIVDMEARRVMEVRAVG
jgi:hypothetical protein